ncbi:MAG: RtcB family protein [Candidatus Hydrothermarchaeota archaeon]
MEIKRIAECVWEIPPTEKEGMLVPARIYATEKLLKEMDQGVFEQVTNVACLPGIQRFSYCMPDGHWGYGFPIGGVAAFDPETGVISPGGIGFDINCGMRLVRTNLTLREVRPRIRELVDALFRSVPAGVGSKGMLKLSPGEFKEMMHLGARWCVEKGYGWERDLERIEEYGCIKGADPEKVSDHAMKRGIGQLGTLGSGNHYLEVQVASAAEIYDPQTAKAFGIEDADQIFVMFHCGSRGFGHQVATDYLKVFDGAMKKYGITVRDRELACAPFRSQEGQDYYKAMACAANNAFANRQMILHRVREAFSQVFGRDAEALGMDIVYDVAHNIAKVERHRIDGGMKDVVVHRKGATRCFGPGREELPPIYRDIGQPVILGGSMETGSYVLVGTERAMEETFGSTAHGSGRTMSRAAAKRKVMGGELQKSLEKRGIIVKAVSMSGLAEEAGFAYKNISEVVEALECAGITRKVVGLKPLGNVKG